MKISCRADGHVKNKIAFEYLNPIGSPIPAQRVEEAFERMLEINFSSGLAGTSGTLLTGQGSDGLPHAVDLPVQTSG